MSVHSRRVAAIQALVVGSPALSAPGLIPRIVAEFREVGLCRAVHSRNRRRVLQILHSTRALDSALKGFAAHHACTARPPSLGGYLRAFCRPVPGVTGQLSSADYLTFRQRIVDRRNHYMHEAGAFPATDTEVMTLLSDMHHCLTTVLAL